MNINKIYCGDNSEIIKLMDPEFIDLVVTSPPYNCYTDDTEALTQKGWQLISEIKVGDKVMTTNPDTREIYYCPVINIYQYDIIDEIIHFHNQDMDLKVTKNHNMYVTNSKGASFTSRKHPVNKESCRNDFFREAINITSGCKLPFSGYEWKGDHPEFFRLPSLYCLYNKQPTFFPELLISMEWWVQFLGFIS